MSFELRKELNALQNQLTLIKEQMVHKRKAGKKIDGERNSERKLYAFIRAIKTEIKKNGK